MASQKRNRKSRARREERRFTVRGLRRDPPDIRKISKALIGLAMAEEERQAQAEQTTRAALPEVASGDEEQKWG